jgi:hypothetical protein
MLEYWVQRVAMGMVEVQERSRREKYDPEWYLSAARSSAGSMMTGGGIK